MFKEKKIMILKILSILIAISAFIASFTGIVFPDIYKHMVLDEEMPFVFAQDLISLIAAILLLGITFLRKKENIKLNIIRIGIIGYLFYAYGQYVMGNLYNYSYFLYLSVFSLSVFYFINAFTGIEYERLEFSIPKSLRIIIAIYCAAITFFFAPQWIIAILHYIKINSHPGGGGFKMIYYVYILDLSFVLPVCAAASIFLFQKKILGLILGGILTIKGFTLMLSVALGFFCRPFFHQNMDVGNAILFSIITLVFLILSILYFIYTKVITTDKSR